MGDGLCQFHKCNFRFFSLKNVQSKGTNLINSYELDIWD